MHAAEHLSAGEAEMHFLCVCHMARMYIYDRVYRECVCEQSCNRERSLLGVSGRHFVLILKHVKVQCAASRDARERHYTPSV